MLTVEKVRLWNSIKDGEPCALKGASTVRGGGHAMPIGLTVPTLRKDFPKAPQGFCKHRLAYGMHKRASALAMHRLDQLNGAIEPPTDSPQGQPQGEAVSPLPGAPASANVHVTLAGRKVQVTLRDSDEQRLLARLEALLQRFPAEEEPGQTPEEGWCSKHDVQMKLRNGEHGSWWSHKTAEGWCKGK